MDLLTCALLHGKQSHPNICQSSCSEPFFFQVLPPAALAWHVHAMSLLCNVLLLQRHRDKISHLMDTLRSIIPPSERQDMSSVLERAIEHINYLDDQNKVCVSALLTQQMLDFLGEVLTKTPVIFRCHRYWRWRIALVQYARVKIRHKNEHGASSRRLGFFTLQLIWWTWGRLFKENEWWNFINDSPPHTTSYNYLSRKISLTYTLLKKR